MEHLRCVVERITYQNTENGYTVLKCTAKNYSDLVTVVGNMPDTHVGSVLSLEAFGKDTLDVIEESPDELLKIPGIGKVRVDRIKTSW